MQFPKKKSSSRRDNGIESIEYQLEAFFMAEASILTKVQSMKLHQATSFWFESFDKLDAAVCVDFFEKLGADMIMNEWMESSRFPRAVE